MQLSLLSVLSVLSLLSVLSVLSVLFSTSHLLFLRRFRQKFLLLFLAAALFVFLFFPGTERRIYSQQNPEGRESWRPADLTNASTTNTNTNAFVVPKTEEGKRKAILEQFLAEADDAKLKAIAKKFKIPAKGSGKELRRTLRKHLGLLKIIRDSREKSEIVVKDVFKSPDLGKNFVIYADEGVHIRSKNDPQSGLITLYGDQGNLYVEHKQQVVSARIIRLDLERHEVFGEGNAMMKEGGRIIIGDKFYFNTETKYGVIYNARTYIHPYFYWGRKIKKIGDRNYVLDDGWFTTCEADPPHYRFGVGKAWLYQDTRLFAVDVSYQVSKFPVFWFPFIYHPMEGTGLHTGVGRDTRVGWFMQISNLGAFFHLPFSLTFDYYQRLGIAMLAKKKLKAKNWNLNIESGIAYDKPLSRRNDGEWVNTVNGNGIYGDESGLYGDWKRELRWRLDLRQSLVIPHDEDNPGLGSTSISANFNIASDAFFKSDFERMRIKQIDIEKLYKQEEVNFFNQGSPAGRNWAINISDRRGGSTLNLGSSWSFRTDINEDAENIYANDYYKYKLSTVVLPRLSYGLSGNIFSTSRRSSSANRTQKKKDDDTLPRGEDGRPDILYLDTTNEQAAATGPSFSLRYSGNINFDQTKRYDAEEELTEQRYTRRLSLSMPASFSWGSVLSSSLSLGLSDIDMWGNATTEAQEQYYDNSSITSLNEGFSLRLGHTFNKGMVSEFGGNLSVRHNLGYRVSDMESETYQYNKLHSHGLSMSASLNFFKTTASASTSYDLVEKIDETRDWGRDRFSPLSVSVSSRPFDFLSISDSFSYIIKTGKSSANNLSVSIRGEPFRLPFIEKVSGLSLRIGWNHSYNDLRTSRLTFSLGFNMVINDLWRLTFSMSSANDDLYLYSENTAAQYNKESRNLLQDFLYSVMFWDSDKLKESRFNLQSLRMSILHDLHNWEMRINASLSQRVNTVGRKFTYFDINFMFEIAMKMNIGISFPEQRYRYTADSEGQYYGEFN